jgi:hypothetical protein
VEFGGTVDWAVMDIEKSKQRERKNDNSTGGEDIIIPQLIYPTTSGIDMKPGRQFFYSR